MELITKITDYPDTLQKATKCIKDSMRTAAQAFVGIGYYLKYIRDKRMYQEAGYIDIWEYGKGELGLSEAAISRYMKINDRFSQNGNSPVLLEEYKGYGYSKLSEMLTLTDEEIQAAGITETTTVAKIREIKKEIREENAEPEPEEQIPGQMNITEMLPVATSQEDGLKVLTDFAKEYYERLMDAKQHELFEEGEEIEFVSYTKEIYLILSEEKKEVQKYSTTSGTVEISPDGYIKLDDGKVRKWGDVYNRLKVLKVLGGLPDDYKTGTWKKTLADEEKTIKMSATPKEIMIYFIAKAAVEELRGNNIEIPTQPDGITELLRKEYEPSFIAFKCGWNMYQAELDGTGEVFLISRLDGKTGQPAARDIFEICIEDIAAEIDKANDKGCDGNCFWCENENCNSRQEKRENCIYDSTKKCNIYKAHEVAIENGKGCKSFCCNTCEENECIAKCSYARAEEKTTKRQPEERKSDWEAGIFEDDGSGYGWARSEMVKSLFEHLHKCTLEIDGIDGESVTGPGNRKRYAFISEDEKYIEFYSLEDNYDEKLDFKVSIKRLEKEYDLYREKLINTSEETEEKIITDNTIEIERAIAIEIVEGIVEDNSAQTVEDIMKTAKNLTEFLREQYDTDAWNSVKLNTGSYEWQTVPNDPFLYVYEITNSYVRTGKYFKVVLDAFVAMVINEYIENYKKDIESEAQEEKKTYTFNEMATYIYKNMLSDEEKIIAAEGHYNKLTEAIKKRYSGVGGEVGPGKPIIEYNGKEFKFNKETISYALAASTILTLLEEGKLEKVEAVEAEVITELPDAATEVIKDIQYNGCAGMDTNGEFYSCPPRREPCDTQCKWMPTGQSADEKECICRECWWTYVKALIEKDRNNNPTIRVQPDTISQQVELPELKNNEQRKQWIENFESWPLWIENEETQERYYRYTFENGDAFVIRKAFSTREQYNYITRKTEKNPHWSYQKVYIVKKEKGHTLADSETNITVMVEYLKNMQK